MHNYSQLETLLEDYLDPVLSSRRTAEKPARGLLPLDAAEQEFVLHWVDVICKSNAEVAYQFTCFVPFALTLMGLDGARKWLLHCLDIYDREGLYPATAAFAAFEPYARHYRLSHITVTLPQVRGVLETMLRGLTGRTLKVEAGAQLFTDTETLYLPAAMNRYPSTSQNYRWYKIAAIHLWAQTWFGTFRRPTPDTPHLSEIIAQFPNPSDALQIFTHLETYRLNACIERELPGLAREMVDLAPPPQPDTTWLTLCQPLQAATATVHDTLQATRQLYARQLQCPAAFAYQGDMHLEAVELTSAHRQVREKTQLQVGLDEILTEMNDTRTLAEGAPRVGEMSVETEMATDDAAQLHLDGEALSVPSDVARLLNSLLQDFDAVPPEWLVAAGDADYDASARLAEPEPTATVPARDGYFYDEWDYRRSTYRRNWCTLRESVAHPRHDDFVPQTLTRYAHLVAQLRRHFAALRGEARTLKAQPRGDDIDLDAAVTACADWQMGMEMSERLYLQTRKAARDLAVVFMVDVSGSTKGWINEAERESLVLLCQALEILGDQYAIYGFSGMTRNRCEVYRVKTFAEPYNAEVQARISGLRPQDYTRMGVVIRHLTQILSQAEARTRLLITLSDGKPDDYDGYRGQYGIEDTRQALLETRHVGIHSFCITIDREANDYLPYMYGHANFAVVDTVAKLPLKIADIYRRVTT